MSDRSRANARRHGLRLMALGTAVFPIGLLLTIALGRQLGPLVGWARAVAISGVVWPLVAVEVGWLEWSTGLRLRLLERRFSRGGLGTQLRIAALAIAGAVVFGALVAALYAAGMLPF